VTTFLSSVPIIPARDVPSSTAWYRDALGYEVVRDEDDYGIVGRDGSWIHLYGPSGIAPERSDTMIRVGVEGIDELYAACVAKDIVHPNGPLGRRPWGLREFAVLDLDGNLVTFFEPEASA
jgi:catechol 2,3-dioxygenase-like lactoylglutathione lyase family enzyme